MEDGNDTSMRVSAKIPGSGDHIGNHAAYGLPRGVKFLVLGWLDVLTIQRVIEPRLCLIGLTDSIG